MARTTTGCLLGATALGERGVSSETVGEAAADALVAALESRACVDEHLADQLIIFMALAEGESRVLAPFPLSLHTLTAIAVAEQARGGGARATCASIKEGHVAFVARALRFAPRLPTMLVTVCCSPAVVHR